MTKRNVYRAALPLVWALFFVCTAPVFAGSKKHPPARPINLNTATAAELEELPGVGPVTAKAILDVRAKSGPFHRVEDLLAVHRISQSKFNKLRPYVTVAPATRVPKPPPKHSN